MSIKKVISIYRDLARTEAARKILIMRPYLESINDETTGVLIRNLAAKIESYDTLDRHNAHPETT